MNRNRKKQTSSQIYSLDQAFNAYARIIQVHERVRRALGLVFVLSEEISDLQNQINDPSHKLNTVDGIK